MGDKATIIVLLLMALPPVLVVIAKLVSDYQGKKQRKRLKQLAAYTALNAIEKSKRGFKGVSAAVGAKTRQESSKTAEPA